MSKQYTLRLITEVIREDIRWIKSILKRSEEEREKEAIT